MLDKHLCKVPVGTLVQFTGKIVASCANSFKDVQVEASEIGLVVDSNVWPDESWPNRSEYQVSAPYYKVLLERKLILVCGAHIPAEKGRHQYVEVIKLPQKEKDNERTLG